MRAKAFRNSYAIILASTFITSFIVAVPASATGVTPAPFITSPSNNATVVDNFAFSFSLPVDPLAGTISLTIAGGSPRYSRTLSLRQTVAGSYTLTFNPFLSDAEIVSNYTQYFSSSSSNLANVTDSGPMPSGTYSVTLAYVDAQGDPASFAQLPIINFTTHCLAGTFSATGGIPIGGACTPAPIGSYVDTQGATVAIACPDSRTTNGIGSTSVSACHQSATQASSMSSPTQGSTFVGNLNVNFQLPETALTNSVKIKIYNAAYTRVITLMTTTSGDHSISFDPLLSDVELVRSQPSVFVGSATTRNSQAFSTGLPIGTYSVGVEHRDIYGNPASLTATPLVFLTSACDPGSYSSSGGKDVQGTCTTASLGHYVDTPGATSELPCAKGTYAPQTGAWRCNLAAPNFYVDTQGASAATACPAKYTSTAGSTSKSACKAPKAAVKYCVIKKGKIASVTCLAKAASTKIPAKSKTSITINKADKVRCVLVKGKLTGKAKGTCRVTLKVTPKKGKPKNYATRVKVL